MARPRKATADLELRGAFRKNPSRLRERESEPIVSVGIGSPPRHIDDSARAIWKRLSRTALWLRETDRDALEVFCVLKAEAETNLAAMLTSRISVMNKYANDLGLTATARTKVKVRKPENEGENPFASFTN